MLKDNEIIEIKVPASSANLGPGFDSFGLALPLYLTVRVHRANEDSIRVFGDHLSSLSLNEENLVYSSFKHIFDLEGMDTPKISLEIESDIPLSSGLGSSGTAILAGLIAANQFLEAEKTLDDIFQIATAMEGHPDNIGASLYGGLVVTAQDKDGAKLVKLPFPKELKIVVGIPNYILPTKLARGKIPENIPLKDVIFNIGHSALLISYILTGQIDKIPSAMKDKLHQPYRQHAVKGLSQILNQAQEMGVGVALSGAGPTIIFFLTEEKIPSIKGLLHSVAYEENIDIDIKVLFSAEKGATVQRIARKTSSN